MMFGCDFQENRSTAIRRLRVEESFDLLTRTVEMDGRTAQLYFVDGLVQVETLSKILGILLRTTHELLATIQDSRHFADQVIPFGEIDITDNEEAFTTFVLSGGVGLLVEGCCESILIDARDYPQRPVMEPENDRVLRGPREGFVESLIRNTALIRRHLRDPKLTTKLIQVGSRSHTDVVLCYLEGTADPKLVTRLEQTLRNVKVGSLTMGLESLTECLTRRRWWNPFPRSRSTERPDSAAACIAEGQIILLMDHNPAGMILPTGIFDFLQDTNDYCFLPVVGSFLRWLRLFVTILSTVLAPLWYFSLQKPEALPDWLEFLKIHEPIALPVLLQFLLIELVVGTLKLASLNTPSSLSNSLAVIGALVLGEFAVKSQLMVPETVLIMSFIAVANFAQPSYELSYALSIMRIVLLLLTALFHGWGLLVGGLLMIVMISLTPTVGGTSYWYPLLPFDKKALKRLFFRSALRSEET